MNRNLFLIIFLALILRLVSINQSLWLDEAINVIAASDRGVVDLVTNYAMGDFHPPLYHVILHYWIRIFGASEISVRIPSVIFGLITILFTYKIGQLLFEGKHLLVLNYKLSLKYIPPLLLATSGLHLYYSQEARMYSLAAMGITVVLYFSLVLLNDKLAKTNLKNLFYHQLELSWQQKNIHNKPIKALFYVLFLLVALLSDYVPWLLIPLLFLLQPVLTTLSLVLIVPWFPFLAKQLGIGLGVASNFPGWGQVVGGISVKNIILIPIKFLIGRVSIDNNLVYFSVLALPLFLCLILFILHAKNQRLKDKSGIIITSWLLLPLIIGILVSIKISLLSYFRFLFVLPAYYLVLTSGLSYVSRQLKPWMLGILITTNLISSGSYLFLPKFHREDWRSMSQYMTEVSANNSAVTMFPSLAQSAPYDYYQKQIPVVDKIEPPQLPQTVFLMRYVQEIFDPTDSKRALIEKLGYHFIEAKNFNGVVVWTYQLPDRLYANR